MNLYLARKFSAKFFIGPSDQIKRIHDKFKQEDMQNAQLALEHGQDPAAVWLKYGEVGLSSKFMCDFLSGTLTGSFVVQIPRDYDDFQRCEKMLNAIPAFRQRLGELAVLEQYAGLVKAWPALSALYQSYQSNEDKWPLGEQYQQFNDIFKEAIHGK